MESSGSCHGATGATGHGGVGRGGVSVARWSMASEAWRVGMSRWGVAGVAWRGKVGHAGRAERSGARRSVTWREVVSWAVVAVAEVESGEQDGRVIAWVGVSGVTSILALRRELPVASSEARTVQLRCGRAKGKAGGYRRS
ncbi:Protein of unknown function [Gryllus bimaculatus]|nr:Protein of unknown function [Gryllus bimaculatus]